MKTVKLTAGDQLHTVTRSAKHFRRLKWHERVASGDCIVNEHRAFEPWEGPLGFRADTFLKPVYRPRKSFARA